MKKINEQTSVKSLGEHLLIEAWKLKNLNDSVLIRKALKEMVKATGATLLSLKIHKFNPHGISGIAVIAESHISIHTWPEYRYAAIDIFTCGSKVNPHAAIPIVKKYFKPKHIKIMDLKRGVLEF
jgi:S-adenosylmethionine decarboxylase